MNRIDVAVYSIDRGGGQEFNNLMDAVRKWLRRSIVRIVDRVHPRFSTEAVVFEYRNTILPSEMEVINLSLGGVALRSPRSKTLKAGLILSGTLRFGTFKHEVELEVRHITETVIGCRFSKLSAQFLQDLERFLEAELVGASLKLIRKDVLKNEGPGDPFWYTDGNRNELFYRVLNGKVIHFSLTFLGHHVQYQEGRPLLIGVIQKESESKPTLYKPSDLLTAKNDFAINLLPLVHRFLTSINHLDSNVMAQIESKVLKK